MPNALNTKSALRTFYYNCALMVNIPQKILTRKHEITTQFLDMLDQHIEDILEGKVTQIFRIKDFAERLGIQPTHFSNTIKLTTKRSPYDLLEERIVAEAKKMLSETSIDVTEISHRLTFPDPAHFTKFFKRLEGKTPKDYRNQFASLELIH